MNQNDLKERTKSFALEIMKLIDELPRTTSGRVIANQLARSATSVGANYRAACRGRSKKEFIAKLEIVQEEADESSYRLELINEGLLNNEERVSPLEHEADELTAIFTSSLKTAKHGRNEN